MRSTQSKLPFTYRTFGVSDAQAQSHHSQQADCSEHLLGGDSARGRRRTTATSFLFSPLSHSAFLFPSPCRPLLLPLLLLLQPRRFSPLSLPAAQKQFTDMWDKTGNVEYKEDAGYLQPYRAAPHRARRTGGCVDRETATKVVSAETGPEISAPRDQTEQRHWEERDGFRRFFFFPPLPLSLSSSALPSLLLLPSPISGTSQPNPTHTQSATLRIYSKTCLKSTGHLVLS